MTPQVIFDFNSKSDVRKWVIVDDVVMGGKSSGEFRKNKDGHGVFKGEVSLENNGGFYNIVSGGNWWSVTEIGLNTAWGLSLDIFGANQNSYYKDYGNSVRCLKD